jgi:hypothetical protein
LVDRFVKKDGFNEPSAKTNRLLDCCRRRNLGGPFVLELALARNAPTGIGRRPSTICGRTSTIASVSSRNRPLALARRWMPAANSSSTRKPLVPARRLLLALAGRRLLLALARRRLHVANAPLKHARRLPPNSSSCGSAAVVSLPGSLA